MNLPFFRYHPDPIATGSVVASDNACACCGQSRGFVYSGPTSGKADCTDAICPWCIVNSAAHEKLGVSFADSEGVGGYGVWDAVPPSVVEEIAYRTPGFIGWQQERWWTHCGDAAAFIGLAGAREVAAHGAKTIEHLRLDLGWDPGEELDAYIRSLAIEGQPTAYLFRCTRCGEVGGYSDFT